MDADSNDIAANGFGNCLTRDGQGQPSANLPMANFRHTGVGNGVARGDYAALGQVQDNIVNWAVAVGTSDAITATLAPPITALTDGQLIYLRTSGANTTVAPTFAPNGLAAHPITRAGGGALNIGDIPGTLAEIILRYNVANTRWELLNPNTPNIPAGTEVHYAGIQAPPGWYLAYGQLISRTSDFALFNALTIATTGNTHSNTTIDNLAQDLRGTGRLKVVPRRRRRDPARHDSGFDHRNSTDAVTGRRLERHRRCDSFSAFRPGRWIDDIQPSGSPRPRPVRPRQYGRHAGEPADQ
jgi:hypothetical protein